MEAAFDKLRTQRRGDHEQALAQALGVSRAKLRQAFEDLRGDFRRGHEQRHEDHAADLAKALGISADKVEAAFEKLRAAEEKEHEQRRSEFAAALAKRLNIAQSKVEDALGDLPPWGPHHHRPSIPLSHASSSSTTRHPSGLPSSAHCASRASPCPRPPAGARRSRR